MKIPVVNEQDEIIDHKERSDRNPDDIIRISCIWVTDENGDVLMQQRKLTKKQNPGKWGPAVAGTVEEGETYETNAYKEMEEEIGVTGVVLTIDKKLYGVTNTGKRFCQLFTAQIKRDTKLFPQEDEVEALRWFSKEELKKEIEENPDKFVGSMKDLSNLFL